MLSGKSYSTTHVEGTHLDKSENEPDQQRMYFIFNLELDDLSVDS